MQSSSAHQVAGWSCLSQGWLRCWRRLGWWVLPPAAKRAATLRAASPARVRRELRVSLHPAGAHRCESQCLPPSCGQWPATLPHLQAGACRSGGGSGGGGRQQQGEAPGDHCAVKRSARGAAPTGGPAIRVPKFVPAPAGRLVARLRRTGLQRGSGSGRVSGQWRVRCQQPSKAQRQRQASRGGGSACALRAAKTTTWHGR